jgi:hypothetical protein
MAIAITMPYSRVTRPPSSRSSTRLTMCTCGRARQTRWLCSGTSRWAATLHASLKHVCFEFLFFFSSLSLPQARYFIASRPSLHPPIISHHLPSSPGFHLHRVEQCRGRDTGNCGDGRRKILNAGKQMEPETPGPEIFNADWETYQEVCGALVLCQLCLPVAQGDKGRKGFGPIVFPRGIPSLEGLDPR